jgi:myo-inositol-1(or 4)-monophosphatase
MDSEELAEIERQVVDVAWQAGRILISRFRQPVNVDWKGKRKGADPVTDVDHRVEEFVREELSHRFSSHAVVGEEGAGAESEPAACTWVVDPLDGTTNFMNGLPAFACSIGLLEHGVPVVGAIFVPWPVAAEAMVLHARTGGGAWVDDQALTVSSVPLPPRSLVVVPRRSSRLHVPLTGGFGERRSVGSIAYEMAATALGTYGLVLFESPRVWDVAAGALLVKEAGGVAMTLPRDSRSWRPLRAFAFDDHLRDEGGEPHVVTQAQLRNWTQPVLAGPSLTVERAAHLVVPYHPLLRRFLRLVRAAP